jgi:hypothetical protein
MPDRPAQVLLRVIEAEPGLVQRIVESAMQETTADPAMDKALDG